LISGKLERPKNFTPETTNIKFDYVSYLAKDKIHFLIYQPEITKLKEGQGNRMIATLYLLKNKFIENINAAIPEPNSSLLNGVILGAKQSLGEKLLTDFKNVGLIHIVVLSGYNLTLIILGVLHVASYFGKRKLGFVVSIFLLILFSLMVGLGATVIRAAIMAMIAILAKHLGRPNDALRALFVAGILMLLWNPLLLTHDPSFQLSFMATLGLILFSPFLETWISQQKWLNFITTKGGVREILASTFAVQLFLLPFLIKMSGTFSLISFLVNLIVLPLVPTLMFLGFATGLSGFLPLIGKFVAWPFGIPSYVLSQIIILITEFSVQLPFSFIQIGSLPTWLVLFWYSGYAFLFWKLKKTPHPRYARPPLD
jgi:competence protein ComEC